MDAPAFKWGENSTPIAGVIRNFQPRGNITRENQPSMLRINKPEEMYPWSIIIEIDGNPYTAYEQIRKAYEQTSGLNFEGKFIDQQIQESFEAQQQDKRIQVDPV